MGKGTGLGKGTLWGQFGCAATMLELALALGFAASRVGRSLCNYSHGPVRHLAVQQVTRLCTMSFFIPFCWRLLAGLLVLASCLWFHSMGGNK